MIKRTIDISSGPARLRIELDQLVIAREGHNDARVPTEDMGVLLIDQRDTVYTHSAMTRLMETGACVVLCGDDHLPCGLLLPMEANELLTARLRKQIGISRPLEKRLWRQVIRAKIAAQAVNLAALPLPSPDTAKLKAMVQHVSSGDATNMEAQAARIYWPALFGSAFRRERGGAWPNPALNYGYMIVRAAVARAIAGAGLHPAFGIHHHNRGNAFCLADDLMEPLRPLVDATVFGLLGAVPDEGRPEVTPTVKRRLLSLLARDVELAGQQGPLMVQLHRMAAGLWSCYVGGAETLVLPTYDTTDLTAGPSNADI